jgi:hypothetical protein
LLVPNSCEKKYISAWHLDKTSSFLATKKYLNSLSKSVCWDLLNVKRKNKK